MKRGFLKKWPITAAEILVCIEFREKPPKSGLVRASGGTPAGVLPDGREFGLRITSLLRVIFGWQAIQVKSKERVR